MKKLRHWGLLLVAAVWLGLAVFAWLHPAQAVSLSERRPLAQFPELELDKIAGGDFMEDFESYSLDQFPARDAFRSLKSLFHYGALGQLDNNGIYLQDGYAAKLEYPLHATSVENAVQKFTEIYEKYLKNTDSNIWFSVVPDKGYYLAPRGGYPAMDYEGLFATVRENLPWAEHIRLTEYLNYDDYYRTDTHWRQERLLPAARKLCQTMGVTVPQPEDYSLLALERPFYGVYYGQAMLPMEPDTVTLLQSSLIDRCSVYNFETGQTTFVYDEKKLTSDDLYDVYLSGPAALLTVENPNAGTDRELILFRDSFGSAMAPLLLQGYGKVTLVDTRYIAPALLGTYLDFHGQDVLFLYSTLVLNNSATLK